MEITDRNGGIWNFIQLIIVLWGLVIFAKHANFLSETPPVKVFCIYTFVAFLFALLHMPSLSVQIAYSFLMILYPGMLLFLSYYLFRTCNTANGKLIVWTFYIISILFVRTQLRYYNNVSMGTTAISDAYYMLCLLPIILVFSSKKYRIIPILLTFATLVFSSKRAGFIGLIAGLIVYFLILSIQEKKVGKFFKYVAFLAIILLILYWATTFLDERYNLHFIRRLLRTIDDGGSGRDIRWQAVTNAIQNSNIINLIFGHGRGTLAKTIGNAHNDFLEVIYENGFIVFFLYLGYHISSIIILIKMMRQKYYYSAEYGLSIVIGLSLAMFSFYITEGTFITCGMITQGYILADWIKNRLNQVQ